MKAAALMILLLCGLCLEGYGQKIRFTDTANRWMLHHWGGGSLTDAYQYVFDVRLFGDTMVNGLVYKKMVGTATQTYIPGSSYSYVPGSTPFKYGLYREDTTAKKVWGILGDSVRVIYDANWQVGDTLPWTFLSRQGRSTVIGIDSSYFLNHWYKVFHMSDSPSSTMRYDIIEGIGSTCGAGFPIIGYTFEDGWVLDCFSNNGARPVISPALGYGVGFDNNVSCKRLEVADKNITEAIEIFPSPGSREMVMRIPVNIRSGKMIVTNAVGQRIMSIGLDKERKIPIGQYLSVAGVYYYELLDEVKGLRYRGRFIYR